MNNPTDELAAENPYIQARIAGSPDSGSVRPLGVTVIAVLAILAGISGVLSSLLAVVQVLFGERFMAMMNQSGTFQEAQTEMQQALHEVMASFFIAHMLLGVAGVVLGGLFFSGGVGLIVRKPWSQKFLRRTIIFAIIFECSRTVVYGLSQLQIVPINQAYMRKITETGGAATIVQFTSIATTVGIAMWIAWVLAKLAAMVWGYRYLGSPIVNAHLIEHRGVE